MVVTPLPMLAVVSPEYLNAASPMLVTVLGMVIPVSDVQLENALFPMLVTLYSVLSLVTVAGMFTSPASALS